MLARTSILMEAELSSVSWHSPRFSSSVDRALLDLGIRREEWCWRRNTVWDGDGDGTCGSLYRSWLDRQEDWRAHRDSWLIRRDSWRVRRNSWRADWIFLRDGDSHDLVGCGDSHGHEDGLWLGWGRRRCWKACSWRVDRRLSRCRRRRNPDRRCRRSRRSDRRAGLKGGDVVGGDRETRSRVDEERIGSELVLHGDETSTLAGDRLRGEGSCIRDGIGSHADVDTARVRLPGENLAFRVDNGPLPDPVERVRARCADVAGDLDVVLAQHVGGPKGCGLLGSSKSGDLCLSRCGFVVELEASTIIEGTRGDQLASLVTSSALSIPDTMNAAIGVSVGSVLGGVDEHSSTSSCVAGRRIPLGDMTILQVAKGDLVSGCC